MQIGAFAATCIISYLVIGVFGFSLALFVFFNPPRNPIKIAFTRYLFIVGWWGLFSIPMLVAPTAYWGTFWDRVCLMGLILTPISFLHFNFIFLNINKKYGNFLLINYVIAAFFLLANFTPYFVPSTSPRFGLKYFTDPSPLYHLFFTYFFLTSLLCILTFFFSYIRAKGNRRFQLFNILWSSVYGYSLGGLTYFTVLKIPPAYLVIIANAGIIFHMVVYAYTITKQRLMDISVVISRAVAEVLTVFFQGAIYLSLVWFYYSYVSTSITIYFLVWTVLYGILVGQTYREIRLLIQTSADNLFLRGRYNYYKSLSDASSHVSEKLSLAAILKVLYETFTKVVEISNPRVYLPEYFSEMEKNSGRYLCYSKDKYLPRGEEMTIANDLPMVAELITQREPLLENKELNAALVVPCLLEDRLIAIFVLGKKLSEDPYTDEDIKLLKVLANQAAVALDHTRSYEKIKGDLEVVERELGRAQRLASLGTLTAGVTHEIRNPLAVIRSETERLTVKPRDAEYLTQYSNLVIKHVDRIAGIISRMLEFAKEKPKAIETVDLNDVIRSTLEMFAISRITLKQELTEVPPVKGDAEELQEVFINLIQNAIEAMPEGGTLTLRSYKEEGKVVTEVSDTGKGIPEEIRQRIFDPFFSTRHEGVGLGLSIVYRIIREHGAEIKVASEVGKGTTFRIIF